jgi:putative RNA 2'-phosphotransferase
MSDSELVKISRFLSKHLRHAPADIGLTLRDGGWVPVDDLLAACGRKGVRITPEHLRQVVRENDKQRFAFDETGTLIRANQGHSVDVDLQLEPATPPETLFHGTAQTSVESIRRDGIVRGRRHHVHLSPDRDTATKVGSRHGKPVVLVVDSGRMHDEGHVFYRSANGVWLTGHVPPAYLR